MKARKTSLTILITFCMASALPAALGDETVQWPEGENTCTGPWEYNEFNSCSYGQDTSKPIQQHTGYEKKEEPYVFAGGPTTDMTSWSTTLRCDHSSIFWFCKSFCSDSLRGSSANDLEYDVLVSETVNLDNGVGECVDWKRVLGRKVSCNRRIYHHKKSCNYKRVKVVPALGSAHSKNPRMVDDHSRKIYTTVGYEPFTGYNSACGNTPKSTGFLVNAASLKSDPKNDVNSFVCTTKDELSPDTSENIRAKFDGVVKVATELAFSASPACSETESLSRYLQSLASLHGEKFPQADVDLMFDLVDELSSITCN